MNMDDPQSGRTGFVHTGADQIAIARIDIAVLVEGESDLAAVTAVAAVLGRDLLADGVTVVPMGGATNIERYVAEYGPAGHDLDLVGLCDIGERDFFERALAAEDVFVCDIDLEDELLRAMGVDEMVAFIESQGELKRFRTMQKQPHQRDRTIEQHLHNYCGIRSGRKVRYARGMVEWLPVDRIPLPLRQLIAHL